MIEYIENCENRFKEEFTACTESLMMQEGLRFIMLSGPTCSGKTTLARMLTEALENAGHKVGFVSIDDFYFNRAELKKRDKLDFESVSAIDLKLLSKCVASLHRYKPTKLPVYDFNTGERRGTRLYQTAPGDITVFEGIQAVYPEITSLFDKSETRSIYISVSDNACLNDEKIPGRTVRLLRRILRDYIKRSTSPDFSLKLWKSVCENEDKSINPYKDVCDYKIDSLLGYDFGVLKEPVTKLLQSVREKDNISLANSLIALLDKVQPIPEELVPSWSLFNEFIGK